MGREKKLDSSNLWFVFSFKKVTQEHETVSRVSCNESYSYIRDLKANRM